MRNRALLIGVPVLAMAVLFQVLLIAIIAGFGATNPAQACDHGPGAEQVGSTTLTAEQTLVATQAVAAVRAFPATRTKPHAAVIVLATGYQESRLRNLDYGDRDSLGFLQQRPSQGWGTPAQVRDVAHATTTFLQHLVQVPGWETMPVTDAASTVQRPAESLRGAYEQWVPLASTLTARIWASTGPAASQAAATSGTENTESVQLAHANLYAGMTARQFSADLTQVVAGRPDVVTLNETYRRTPAELTPPGYAMWRAERPFDARETPVLWATDRWQRIDAGTQLMHRHPGKWGTRYVNWVTLQSTTTGQRVSVISGHASPGGPGRTGLLREFVTHLNTLINRLNAAGPVLVGADLNTHHPNSPFLRQWLAASRSATTFDTLGQPTGGWATGIHGGTIDYILTAGATATAHATSHLPNSDHRLLTATVTLSNSGPSRAGQQGACSGLGGQSVPENCTANGGGAEAGLTPDALRVMRCALTVFGPHAVGGVGERPNVSDHTTGRAVDIMIDGFDTPAGNTRGWEIARWAQANAVQLGVTYVIFDAKIWSLARSSTGWRPYTHPTGASSPTLSHRDHVHISVQGNSGTSPTQPISLQAAASHADP